MKRLDQNYEKQQKKLFQWTSVTAIIALFLAFLVLINLFTYVFLPIRYYGNGMEPTLSSGCLLITRKTEKVSEGDVIAFYYNNKILVRRVICEGGKQLSMTPDGTVYINGVKLNETYLATSSLGQCNLDFPYYVAPDHYFVMGDNRDISMDSRLAEIGTIPADRVIGKVLFSL